MTNKQIKKWLKDFHEDLENRTHKEYLSLQELLKLMPEECGRTYIDMGNKTFGTDYSYNEIMKGGAKEIQ